MKNKILAYTDAYETCEECGRDLDRIYREAPEGILVCNACRMCMKALCIPQVSHHSFTSDCNFLGFDPVIAFALMNQILSEGEAITVLQSGRSYRTEFYESDDPSVFDIIEFASEIEKVQYLTGNGEYVSPDDGKKYATRQYSKYLLKGLTYSEEGKDVSVNFMVAAGMFTDWVAREAISITEGF